MNEDNENLDLEVRFRRKLHATIHEFEFVYQMYPDEAKSELKTLLRNKGLIKVSTKELDIKGLAIACNLLEEIIRKEKLC